MLQLDRRVRPAAFLALAWLCAIAACKGGVDADAHYRVRGMVMNVSGTGDGAYAVIHHERIPAFKDRDGQASAMESMQMNFLLGPGVSSDAFKPGAKLALEFDVRWSKGDPLLITRATPLPETTQLLLSEH